MATSEPWRGSNPRRDTHSRESAEGQEQMVETKCPKCGQIGLAAFSPSGLGIAACDACGTYWDDGAFFVPSCGEIFASLRKAQKRAEETGGQEVEFLPEVELLPAE